MQPPVRARGIVRRGGPLSSDCQSSLPQANPSGHRRSAAARVALLVAAVALLGGCVAPPDGTTTPATTTTALEPGSGVPRPTAPPAPSGPATETGPTRPDDASGPYPVVQVVDGDTVKILRDGQKVTLRLIGLDTPETKDPRKPVQCFGREASDRAHALLDDQSVWLTGDPSQGELDRYDRTLAYLWMPDGRLFNWLMVWDGYAHEYTYDLPYRYQEEIRDAERSAREGERGLWSPDTCAGDTTRPA